MGREPEPADDEAVFQGPEIRGGDRPADYITEPVTGRGNRTQADYILGEDTDDDAGDA